MLQFRHPTQPYDESKSQILTWSWNEDELGYEEMNYYPLISETVPQKVLDKIVPYIESNWVLCGFDYIRIMKEKLYVLVLYFDLVWWLPLWLPTTVLLSGGEIGIHIHPSRGHIGINTIYWRFESSPDSQLKDKPMKIEDVKSYEDIDNLTNKLSYDLNENQIIGNLVGIQLSYEDREKWATVIEDKLSQMGIPFGDFEYDLPNGTTLILRTYR